MTKEAINRAMAEIEGWKPTTDGGICWDVDGNPIIEYPAYTEDLNAVARVVEKLSPDHWRKYRANIIRACTDSEFEIDPIDATAAQRCEAILRACGKQVEA